MRLALVVLLALVSCSDESARVAYDNRTVTTPGGSCGMWQETKGNPPTLVYVHATCGEGLSCDGIAFVRIEPADLPRRNFGTCLPADALTCGIPSPPCPPPFTCLVGEGIHGACVRNCTTHSDCPDSYQICDGGICAVMPCEMPADGGNSCGTGIHCQDRICRPD
jgi:hypothetical protein